VETSGENLAKPLHFAARCSILHESYPAKLGCLSLFLVRKAGGKGVFEL